jgi:transposase
MLNVKDNTPVFLACGNTDMRKSINGLVAIVENSFAVDLFDSTTFVFCNHQRNRLKILTWEDNGFWLHFKRLKREHFIWPAPGETANRLDIVKKIPNLKKLSCSPWSDRKKLLRVKKLKLLCPISQHLPLLPKGV